MLCQCLFDVKVHDRYSSNIRVLVDMKEFKLVGLKSHDFHTLMQHLLPIAIWSILPKMFNMLLQGCACFLTRYVARWLMCRNWISYKMKLLKLCVCLSNYFHKHFWYNDPSYSVFSKRSEIIWPCLSKMDVHFLSDSWKF